MYEFLEVLILLPCLLTLAFLPFGLELKDIARIFVCYYGFACILLQLSLVIVEYCLTGNIYVSVFILKCLPAEQMGTFHICAFYQYLHQIRLHSNALPFEGIICK